MDECEKERAKLFSSKTNYFCRHWTLQAPRKQFITKAQWDQWWVGLSGGPARRELESSPSKTRWLLETSERSLTLSGGFDEPISTEEGAGMHISGIFLESHLRLTAGLDSHCFIYVSTSNYRLKVLENNTNGHLSLIHSQSTPVPLLHARLLLGAGNTAVSERARTCKHSQSAGEPACQTCVLSEGNYGVQGQVTQRQSAGQSLRPPHDEEDSVYNCLQAPVPPQLLLTTLTEA